MNLVKILLPLTLGASLIVGCSSSDTPAPPGDDHAVDNAMKTMSKEDKIKFYKNSPLPPAEKAAKLKELGAEPDTSSPAGAGVPGK